MALTVTPTSGAAPYFLTATVENAYMIDGVKYISPLRGTSNVGSCPTAGTSSIGDQLLIDSLLAGDTVELPIASVPAGSCHAISLRIIDQDTATTVSIATVTIDNV